VQCSSSVILKQPVAMATKSAELSRDEQRDSDLGELPPTESYHLRNSCQPAAALTVAAGIQERNEDGQKHAAPDGDDLPALLTAVPMNSLKSDSAFDKIESMYGDAFKPKESEDAIADATDDIKRGSSTPSFVEASLLLYSIFYAAVSRLPFALWAIHMINELEFDFLTAGVTLGLYCFGRLVGAYMSGMYLGSATMLFGTASGAIAWSLILLFEQQLVFISSTFLLGFTETVTGLDAMLKLESLLLKRPAHQTQIIFRAQLIFTCLGVFLAYLGGGVLYQAESIREVGFCCVALSVVNLGILGLVYWRRRCYWKFMIRVEDILEASQAADPTKRRTTRACVGGAVVSDGRMRVTCMNSDDLELIDDEEEGRASNLSSLRDAGVRASRETCFRKTSVLDADSAMKSSLFLGTVVACFFFTTMGISTQFAISALYWQEVWSVGPDVVGTIMAIGEGLGVCCLVIFGQPAIFNSPLTRYFGAPANVLIACLGMGAMCWLTTADNKSLCALGTVCIHMCNVCVHSFQAELIGSCADGANFHRWISLSYMVKRLANCVCVFGSLFFFDLLGPQASYHAIGSILALYAGVLCCVYCSIGAMPCQRRRAPEA